MPPPAAITNMGNAARLCGNFPRQFANPHGAGNRVQINRNYHVYLDVYMQSKHCNLMRGLCLAMNIQPRQAQGSQIHHAGGATAVNVFAAPAGFYVQRGGMVADVVVQRMIARWQAPQIGGQSVFTPGVGVNAGVQHAVQPDGYRYEIDYWYDVRDIYCLFHGYPN